jgi:hypothetical protein
MSEAMGRKWRPRLMILLLLLLAGCAGPSGRRSASSWFEARGADLMDVVGLRVAVGPGLGVMARATHYLQLGVMIRGPSEQDLAGTSDGTGDDQFSLRGVPCLMFGTIGRFGGVWLESAREYAIPMYSTREHVLGAIRRKPITGVVPLDGRDDPWKGTFGLGVHALLVGVEAEVRPLELVDFFGGLLGYDPSGDDPPVEEPLSES